MTDTRPNGFSFTANTHGTNVEVAVSVHSLFDDVPSDTEVEFARELVVKLCARVIDAAGLRQNIVIDRDRATRLGVSVGDIDGALFGAFGQREISTIHSGIHEYKVVINALPEQTATPAAKVTVRYFVLHEKRYSRKAVCG